MALDLNTHFLYVYKDANTATPLTFDRENFDYIEYLKVLQSDVFSRKYPLSSSITLEHFAETTENYTGSRGHINSLINVLNRASIKSPHYLYSSSYGDKSKQEITLISVPTVMFGSEIKKNSVELSVSYSGTLVAKLQDSKLNGELVETIGSNTGSVAGVVLYEQGFVLLTGSWGIYNDIKWSTFGTGSEDTMNSASFDFNFQGTNHIPTITMFAHANKGEFNHSNNPTFLKYGQGDKYTAKTGSNGYYEDDTIEIKNITKYPYENFSGSLEKQVYISKICLYDDKKNIIGIAKLAKPIRKSESRDFTFKLKLDL